MITYGTGVRVKDGFFKGLTGYVIDYRPEPGKNTYKIRTSQQMGNEIITNEFYFNESELEVVLYLEE